ncbi:FAD-binding domain-containing protein [Dothidotthia symphoricarpi CBS 119687]|uniref:FAD-binding domain-containing protein n=1 Tax=Dothidotthia symphoricarpi CBS 119687 TaxID=1392245 RepID=A0A6A6A7B9_9PLEO|nr:FAD-binding domain-containing protein [Dothidotthia symphoricarpi CBS 119687]KAF2127476.1 FAD-binding domain-containing protein [Dothidotthia symphoricarpi CBS 119687]
MPRFTLVLACTLLCATFASCQSASRCKAFPGDEAWPSESEWDVFNTTVGGRLIATVPLGAPCHGSDFDATTCNDLKSQWQYEEIHYNSSSSVMAPIFANQSCDPFQPRERPCELGNYVRYAVDASGASDVRLAIAFAALKNLRLVVRNTGHDYLGRSTGAGSLAVWTHHLKNIDLIQSYNSSEYSGPAFKIGAGVQGFEIMAAARDNGLVVVGGECPTVGIAGGYTQGGGHSALSTSFGLSADNVLNWEVVTATGRLVNANKKENPDLYWALNGGGGSTYGIVVSMTVKTYKDTVISGASLSFFTTDNSQIVFYDAIQAFHEELPAMVDAGTMVVHYFTDSFFSISPINAYNKTATQVKAILAPFVSRLDSKGINYTTSYTEYKTYYEHYDKYYGPLPLGNIKIGTAQYGARFIPRSVVSNITETWKAVVEKGVTWIGVGTNVKPFGSHNTTSVHPAWRDTIVHATLTLPWNFTAPWSEGIATQEKMTKEIIPLIEAATPGSGAYANEGDWRQPNFQTTFWGSNYNKLLSIKKKWDPLDLFYATVGVGSEAWTVHDDGRMCRAG